jgi:hypothetical protein
VITGEVSSKGGRINRTGQPIQVAENFLTNLGHFHSANIEIYTWTSSQNLTIDYSIYLSRYCRTAKKTSAKKQIKQKSHAALSFHTLQ